MILSKNIYLDNVYMLIKYQNYDKYYLSFNSIHILHNSYFSFYRYDNNYIKNTISIIKKSFLHLLNLIEIRSKSINFNSSSYQFHHFIEYKNNMIKLLEQSMIGLNNFIISNKYYKLSSSDKLVELKNYLVKLINNVNKNYELKNIEKKIINQELKSSKDENIIYLKPIKRTDRFNKKEQNNIVHIPPLLDIINYNNIEKYDSFKSNNSHNKKNHRKNANICDCISMYVINFYFNIKNIINF